MSSKTSMKEEVCFFCDEKSSSGSLHLVSTFTTDSKVRECALKLQDTALIAKLSTGDLVAQEAKYHTGCLASLYKRASRLPNEGDTARKKEEKSIHGLSLAEVVTFIEQSKMLDDVVPVFKMTDTVQKYKDRLKMHGLQEDIPIHSTRLMHRIMDHVPGIQNYKEGRDNLLAFKDDIGSALQKACEEDMDYSYMNIASAAKLIRKDIFNVTTSTSKWRFSQGCQQKDIPLSLLTFLRMLLCGPDNSGDDGDIQSTLSIAQLIMFNTFKGRNILKTRHHSMSRETPLPLYLGIMIHCKTRSRDLIERLFQLGLSVSYDRVLSVSASLTNSICMKYQMEDIVCPPILRKELFTVSAIDNIDHNPSSTTSKDSFHGTGISIFQQRSSLDQGTEITAAENVPNTRQISTSLPESYSNVPPAILKTKFPAIPDTDDFEIKVTSSQSVAIIAQREYQWIQKVDDSCNNESEELADMSWGAHFASNETNRNAIPCISALLPLFDEEAKSVAMIKHSMGIIKKCVEMLNPGQTPVIAMDQPLFAVAKQIQWNWPDEFGEGMFVIMFGGLHIEMALFKTLGDWLDGSGWTSVISAAQITSPGIADSLLKASHVLKTRRTHQVTACALFQLLKLAYNEYCQSHDDDLLTLEEWCSRTSKSKPQFHYWFLTLNLELSILEFVRSIREGNFNLYRDILTSLMPWIFALDHHHYARWLPVHLRDMMCLESKHPDLASQFHSGNFVINKTHKRFSSIAIDHAHEQNNALIKSDGGAVGLFDSPQALHRWMVGGPEMSRLVQEFESSVLSIGSEEVDDLHHEQKPGYQKAFLRDVKSLVHVIEEFGNPFQEESDDILVLDSKDIISAEVKATIAKIEHVGSEQFKAFVQDRLTDRKIPVFDPIKKNSLPLFRTPKQRVISKDKEQISSLKSDCALFARLYISCQTRGGDLDDFFSHENQSFPPSLSTNGTLRQCNKADLVTKCLEPLCSVTDTIPDVHTVIIDGAALVNMLHPGRKNTFADYAINTFLPYILRQLQHCTRVDVVWDVYFSDSLKSSARAKRGKGVRRRVDDKAMIPQNWSSFLRFDENKSELFQFLSSKLMEHRYPDSKVLVTTFKDSVMCKPPFDDTSSLEPCDHEEADTRMMLHLQDATIRTGNTAMIRTVDTDVVVLAISVVLKLQAEQLWIGFGTGNSFRYIPVHDIAKTLGPDKCHVLPAIHAFTGCDNVSSFGGKGKKTAWDTWSVCPEVTCAFQAMVDNPETLFLQDIMQLIERYVISMYDRRSQDEDVNDC